MFSLETLARISDQLTVEAHDGPAITSVRLLAVLNVGFKYARIVQETSCRAARALYGRASQALRLATWREKRASYFPAQNTRGARGGDCHQFRAFKESTTYGRIRTRNWLTVPSHHRAL